MAVQLMLQEKGTGRFLVGNDYIELDGEIAEAMHGVADEVRWFADWMNTIGFGLALGKSFDEVRKNFDYDEETVKICDWLAERFTNESYMTR